MVIKTFDVIVENGSIWDHIRKFMDNMDAPLMHNLMHAEEMGIKPVTPPRTPGEGGEDETQ